MGHRRNLTCEYLTSEQSHKTLPSPDRSLYGLLVDDDRTNLHSIDYPTMMFLDPSVLQNGQVEISPVNAPIAAHILQLLGSMNDICTTVSSFFAHIHLWMPFICKKRFFEVHLRLSFQSRPEVALLLLSLKLVTTLPPTSPRNPRTSLYYTLKHFYLEVEGSSTVSILVLQAGVLLALYELGQAIYPAAYLSIGACARYAHAIGINSSSVGTKRVLTLVEVQERRRVWWAIVILDRSVPTIITPQYSPLATINDGKLMNVVAL